MDRGVRQRIFARWATIAIVITCTGCASFKSSPLERARADALEKRQMAGRLEETKEANPTPEHKLAAGDRFHATAWMPYSCSFVSIRGFKKSPCQ